MEGMAVVPTIEPIPALRFLAPNGNSQSTKSEGATSFSEMLKAALDSVSRVHWEAEQASIALATGQISDVHQVMIAQEKANIALQLTIAIRNKVIEAYQEISRMQI